MKPDAVRKLVRKIFLLDFELPEPRLAFRGERSDGIPAVTDFPNGITFYGDVDAETVYHEAAHWCFEGYQNFAACQEVLVSDLGRIGARRHRKRGGR